MCLPLLEQGHGRCSRYRQPQKAKAGGAGSHRSPPDRDPARLAQAWALPAGPLRPARPFPALCRRSNAFSRGHPAHGPFSPAGKAEGPGAASCFPSGGLPGSEAPRTPGGPVGLGAEDSLGGVFLGEEADGPRRMSEGSRQAGVVSVQRRDHGRSPRPPGPPTGRGRCEDTGAEARVREGRTALPQRAGRAAVSLHPRGGARGRCRGHTEAGRIPTRFICKAGGGAQLADRSLRP